jgi:predicted GIY-YIG superfamily endonuclease
MSELIAFALGAAVALIIVLLWPLPLTHIVHAPTAKRMINRRPALVTGYCVYVLFHGSKVVYVGMTETLHRRLQEHKGKSYTHQRAIACKHHEHAYVLEKHLIRVFRSINEAHLNKK